MNQMNEGDVRPDVQDYKTRFLGLFRDECREDCIVAKAASARAARITIAEKLDIEAELEKYAPRFGHCALGPDTRGRCQTISVCTQDVVGGEEDPNKAAELLLEL